MLKWVLALSIIASLWVCHLHCVESGDPLSYCSVNSCDCFITVATSSTQELQQVKQLCVNRSMLVIDELNVDDGTLHGIRDSLQMLALLLQTTKMAPNQFDSTVICYINMSDYDKHAYAPVELSSTQCDGYSTDSVTLIARCLPLCSAEYTTLTNASNSNNELLAGRVLNYWSTGTEPSNDGGCTSASIQTIPCCKFPNQIPEGVAVSWDYRLGEEPHVSVSLACSNQLQTQVRSRSVINCNKTETVEERLVPGCAFDYCLTNMTNDAGRFQQPLYESVSHLVGDLKSPQDLVMIGGDDSPELAVVCRDQYGSTQSIQIVECIYDKDVKYWHWNLTSLSICVSQGDSMSIQSLAPSYASWRMNSHCLVLSLFPTSRREESFCSEYRGDMYKPSLPLSSGADNFLFTVLASGQQFWLGHSYIQTDEKTNRTYMEWLDGDKFNWSNTNTSMKEYANTASNKKCFVLDTSSPDHYVVVDCSLQLRELCYLNNVSNIPSAEWSDWMKWQPCYNGMRERRKSCSSINPTCTGCNGTTPRQSENCCVRRHSVQHAKVEFPKSSEVRVICDVGYELSSGETSAVFSCQVSPNWQQLYNPQCLPNNCPSPQLTSALSVAEDIPTEYYVGDRLTYLCEPGYEINGSNLVNKTVSCLPSGLWSEEPPVCVGKEFSYLSLQQNYPHVLWDQVKVIELATELVLSGRKREGDIVFPGDELLLKCTWGYEFMRSSSNIRIEVTNKGFMGMKRCRPVTCDLPPRPTIHSYISSGQKAQTVGSSLTYQCVSGYVDSDRRLSQVSLSCTENRTWVGGDMLSCTARACSRPPSIDNGEIFSLNGTTFYSTNDMIEIVCNVSFGVLINGKYRQTHISYCDSHGEWSDSHFLQCTPVKCPQIEGLIRAEVVNRQPYYYSGDTVTIRCYPNHVFIGDSLDHGKQEINRVCGDDGAWVGSDEYYCYTNQLQYGATVGIDESRPGRITITWLNTASFTNLPSTQPQANQTSGAEANYTLRFIGEDEKGFPRVNITLSHAAVRDRKMYSMSCIIPPGFHYHIWISARISEWSEEIYGEPDTSFYLPTGIPALAEGFTMKDMVPTFTNGSWVKDYDNDDSTIEIRLEDIFSRVNGSVHQFNIIVIERNEFLLEKYVEGTITDNLTTWAAAQEFPYWPPYLIHEKCQIFTGSGCPDITSGAGYIKFANSRAKRMYTARDPIFKGDNAFISTLGGTMGLEDVAVTNDNLFEWIEPGHRQSGRTVDYVIGSQKCSSDDKAVYCNGKLKYSADYCIKLRAHTADHYLDSACAKAVEDMSMLQVQWHRARVLPLLFSLVPFGVVLTVMAGVLLQRGSKDIEEEPTIQVKKDERHREKIRTKWRNAIFKAYDAVLTTDTDPTVSLLAVASHDHVIRNGSLSPTRIDAGKGKYRLERKCSYFKRNRKWFERMRLESYSRDVSFTSLTENQAWDELFDPNQIIEEQHIPYHYFN